MHVEFGRGRYATPITLVIQNGHFVSYHSFVVSLINLSPICGMSWIEQERR